MTLRVSFLTKCNILFNPVDIVYVTWLKQKKNTNSTRFDPWTRDMYVVTCTSNIYLVLETLIKRFDIQCYCILRNKLTQLYQIRSSSTYERSWPQSNLPYEHKWHCLAYIEKSQIMITLLSKYRTLLIVVDQGADSLVSYDWFLI